MRIYENIKSIVLTLLIGISLILTGSLWFDNYYGLSSVVSDMISFFYPKIDLEDTKYIKNYVTPYKTTIANGDNGKWIYYISSEANTASFEFIKNTLINLTEFTVDSAYQSEWQELVNRKSIICEFADKIDGKALNLVLNNKLEFPTSASIGISGLAITKTTSGGIIYINSDDIIYRITINDIGEFDQIISLYSNFKTYAKYVKLDELGVLTFNGRKIDTQHNVLFPLSAKNNNRHTVSRIVANNLLDKNVEKIEEKITQIFNSNEYIKFITNENGYIYINDDETVIKVYDNDVIEYTSESSNDIIDDVTWISSFNTALRFINMVSELKNLYLVSASNSNNVYEFVFGTYAGEIPIVDTKNNIFDNDKAKIYIKVQNNSVVNYKEKLHIYSENFENVYISKFAHNILDNILVEVPKNSTIKINSIELVYDVSSGSVLPLWKTEYQYNGNDYTILTEAVKLRNY